MEITYSERPELKSPFLVAAFNGWPDAAEAASRGLSHLIRQLKARHFAEVNCEDYFNFTQCRPAIVVEDGAVTQLRVPGIDFYYWKNVRGSHDIILMKGTEPELRWKTFTSTLIRFAQDMGVFRIVTLGALYDNTPHTRTPKVSGIVNAVGLKKLLASTGVNAVSYRGPGAIHSLMLSASARARIEMISLWGHPPFYMRNEANPRVCMALVEAVSKVVNVNVDLRDLRLASEQTDRALDHLVADNPLLRSQVKEMEDLYDSEIPIGKLAENSEQVIRDVEDFLRNENGRES